MSLCENTQVGAHRYMRELLKRIDTLLADQDMVLLVPEGQDPHLSYEHIRVTPYGKVVKSKFGKRLAWQRGPLVRYVEQNDAVGIDLTIGLPQRAFSYVSILDCIREDFPQEAAGPVGALKYRLYQRRVRQALASGADVITLSETSKQAILDHYEFDPARIHLVGCGWEHMRDIEEEPAIIERLGLAGKEYVFALGTRLYHKNHRWVLKSAAYNPDFTFVVTGDGQAGNDGGALAPNVVHTGYVSDGEMKALMRHAVALIQPSYAEGFGLPPLEALALGTPVIVSNASCFPEIYGDCAHYLDPARPALDIRATLAEPVAEPSLVLSAHTWDGAAHALATLIEEKMG